MHRVRDLAYEDLDALLALYTHMHASDAPLPPRSEVERIWQELCSDPRYVYLGADADGALVASSTVAVVPNLTRGARPYGVIENVVTHTKYRRLGLARAVVGEALARCWARDCYKVMLMSGRGREQAHELYESLGFDRDAKQAFIVRRD